MKRAILKALSRSKQKIELLTNLEKISILCLSYSKQNKAGYTATPVACGWAGTIFEVTRAFGQEQYGQSIKKHEKK